MRSYSRRISARPTTEPARVHLQDQRLRAIGGGAIDRLFDLVDHHVVDEAADLEHVDRVEIDGVRLRGAIAVVAGRSVRRRRGQPEHDAERQEHDREPPAPVAESAV